MDNHFRSKTPVPANVCIHIMQAVRWKAKGEPARFETQLERLKRKELEPNGLTLLNRDLANGRSRFIVKEVETGVVCAMLDFAQNGTLETGSFDARVDGAVCEAASAAA